MKTKIIILTGKAQSGKDTSSLFVNSYLTHRGLSSCVYSFANSLKNLCVNVLGLKHNQCWGSNTEKDSKTNFKWSNLPLSQIEINDLVLENNRSVDCFMTAREVMQVFGTNIFRSFHPDCWVQSTINQINRDKLSFAIISDARFPNEIDLLGLHEPLVIRLTRNVMSNSHESETALDDYVFGANGEYYEIDNSVLSIQETNNRIAIILGNYV